MPCCSSSFPFFCTHSINSSLLELSAASLASASSFSRVFSSSPATFPINSWSYPAVARHQGCVRSDLSWSMLMVSSCSCAVNLAYVSTSSRIMVVNSWKSSPFLSGSYFSSRFCTSSFGTCSSEMFPILARAVRKSLALSVAFSSRSLSPNRNNADSPCWYACSILLSNSASSFVHPMAFPIAARVMVLSCCFRRYNIPVNRAACRFCIALTGILAFHIEMSMKSGIPTG
mmetsp:Transcript_31919/g.66086  ORF Transcript_31919/g.66086 Transcript_31919/m.66086 type:complete len:230 (+) Transcript_31919:121-810(+)